MKITVNGEELDNALVVQEADRLGPDYERYVEENQADPPEGQLQEWAEENIIERMVMMQTAAEMDIEVPAEQIDEAFYEVKDNIGDTPESEVRDEITLQIKLDILLQQAVVDREHQCEDEHSDADEGELAKRDAGHLLRHRGEAPGIAGAIVGGTDERHHADRSSAAGLVGRG